MASRKSPGRKRQRTPAVINKAGDLVTDRAMAEALGWLGRGYRPPAGPPWPWDDLAGADAEAFAAAVKRLQAGDVPALAAQVLCWSNGDWRGTCRMIADAEAVQVFPERQHIRLVPKATYYVPPPKRSALPG